LREEFLQRPEIERRVSSQRASNLGGYASGDPFRTANLWIGGDGADKRDVKTSRKDTP
jgi:hypothetical protein